MAVPGNVVQMLVVGAEQKTVGRQVAVQQAVYKHRKVFRRAALAHQHSQARAQLFGGLCKGGALMLGADARGCVGLQLSARKAGGVGGGPP